MKVQLYDDGEDKSQSFEARLSETSAFRFTGLTGYGIDREEAVAGLKRNVAARIAELQAIDFDQEPEVIAWDGTPLDAQFGGG
jgi:hypothetical protein